jgi:NAD(P)-dependent dehydrogenase (short-subunit alcohol dehydrogenase family)
MTLALVTGSNRGIGLSLVKALRSRGVDVVAACRSGSPELEKTGAEIVSGIEVTDPESLEKLAIAIGARKLSLLVNNAGILEWEGDSLGSLSRAGLEKQFQVNALAPLLLTEKLRGSFEKDGKLALITSRMGSIGDNSSGGHYGYRMSKAALNAAGVSLARDLKSSGVAVAILHPGMVSTDMIGGRGQIAPDDAAKNLLARVDALTLETSGTFWHANGEILPW